MLGLHDGEAMGSAPLRFSGHAAAPAEAGLAPEPGLMITAGAWHRSTGAEAAHRLIDSGVAFDAVFALNDTLALGAMYALQRRGRSIPDDVAVIGFDNIDDGAYSTPSLSTIDPGRGQIAQTAVRLLLGRIDHPDTGEQPVEVAPSVDVVARESTGA